MSAKQPKRTKRTRREPGKRNPKLDTPSTIVPISRLGLSGSTFVGTARNLGVPDNNVITCLTIFQLDCTNSGANYANKRIILTALGSAMEIASEGTPSNTNFEFVPRTMYTRYRVVGARVNYTVYNNDSSITSYSVFPSNDVVNKNTSSFPTYRVTPLGKNGLITGAGSYGSIQYGSFSLDFTKFLGSKGLALDDSFAGATNPSTTPSVPSNNVYLNIGSTTFGNSMTLGLKWMLIIEQEVVFYEKSQQAA